MSTSHSRNRALSIAAIAAIATACATGSTAALIGGTMIHRYAAVSYMAIVAAAIITPRAIAPQLIAGQLLAALALATGTPLLGLLPVIAGIIITTELLGLVARLDTPLGGLITPGLGRIVLVVFIGAAVFAAVSILGPLPGPAGFLAVALASATCFGLGLLLVRYHPARDDAPV